MTRDEQIKTLANRMNWTWIYQPVSEHWSKTCATIAIELAEATRKAIAKSFDDDAAHIEEKFPDHEKNWFGHVEGLREYADDIRAMPLPIADERGGSATDE